jgi:hypothetical protein
LIAVSTFALALSAGRLTPAQACSCVNACKSESDCIKESFKYAAAVFVGTPIEIDVQPVEFKFGNRTIQSVNYHIRFAVKESFKGMAASYAVSDNGSGGGDCSYGKMDKGRDYLIYAESISGGSAVGIHACSRILHDLLSPLNACGDQLVRPWASLSLRSPVGTDSLASPY